MIISLFFAAAVSLVAAERPAPKTWPSKWDGCTSIQVGRLATELPPAFEICGQHRYRMDSADWAFRRTNRLATLKWGVTKAEIGATIAEFEERAFADLPMIDKKVQDILASKAADKEPFTVSQYLTKYTNDFGRAAVQKYLELGDKS